MRPQCENCGMPTLRDKCPACGHLFTGATGGGTAGGMSPDQAASAEDPSPSAHLFRTTPDGVSPRPWQVDADGELVDARGVFVSLDPGDPAAHANIAHIAHMANNWDDVATAARIGQNAYEDGAREHQEVARGWRLAHDDMERERDALLAERAELRAALGLRQQVCCDGKFAGTRMTPPGYCSQCRSDLELIAPKEPKP